MVFHDRSLGSLLGANTGQICEMDVGDPLYIAWIEDGGFQTDRFKITKISHGVTTGFEISNGSRDGCLSVGCQMSLFVDDTLEGQYNGTPPSRLALGVSTSSDGLALEMIITLTSLGYSPQEAIDYTVILFGIKNSIWSGLRDQDPEDVADRVTRVHEELQQLSFGGQQPGL